MGFRRGLGWPLREAFLHQRSLKKNGGAFIAASPCVSPINSWKPQHARIKQTLAYGSNERTSGPYDVLEVFP
jgi:hypothetical protein